MRAIGKGQLDSLAAQTLPPAAIYYAFKRYMVSGLTAGAVKG